MHLLSEKERYYIIFLYEQGKSNIAIANEMNIHRKVAKWINRFEETETIKRKDGSGRKYKTTHEEDLKYLNTIKNEFITVRDLQKVAHDNNIKISGFIID